MSQLLLISLVFFATLGHGYLWVDAVNRLHAWAWPRKIIDGTTLLCLLAFLILPLLIILFWSQLQLSEWYSVEMPFSWLRSYVLLCAVWGIIKLVICFVYWCMTDNSRTLLDWKQEKPGAASHLGREQFHGTVAQLLSYVPGNQVFQLTVDRKQLAIPRLHANHEGLKIAHISDLHMTGRVGPEWYEIVAEQVNQLEPDMIAITGDIVEKQSCWPWLANSLGKLQAELGVYFILGNHDFYLNVDHTKEFLEGHGLICLSQRWVEIEHNNASIILAGNERPWNPRATDLSTAPAKNSEQLPLRIVLSHSPDQIAWGYQQDADLMLAGHTHGGQIRFPLLGPIVSPSHYGTRFACGVFQRGNTVMHVTRGVGGKTPLRWRCPPEIALLELTHA